MENLQGEGLCGAALGLAPTDRGRCDLPQQAGKMERLTSLEELSQIVQFVQQSIPFNFGIQPKAAEFFCEFLNDFAELALRLIRSQEEFVHIDQP